VQLCAGFGWGKVGFLHSSWYRAMLCACAENHVDSTEMFPLLLSSAYIAKNFPASHPTPPVRSWGCTRSWVGTWLGQPTPADRRDIPYLWHYAQYVNGGWL